MSAKYLTLAGALAGALVWSAAAQAAPGQTTKPVNLRSGPSTSYAVIARLPAGAPVDIGNCRNWCELTYGQSAGWVRANSVVAVYNSAPYAYYDEPYSDEPYDGFFTDNGPFFGGFHHHGGFGDGGHGFGGHGGMRGGHGGMGGGSHGGGHGGGGGGRH